MKQIYLTALLVMLASCGGSDDKAAPAADCNPTKSVLSTWTSRSTGNIYAMSTCAFNANCQVLFGAAPCNDARGDFTIFIEESGTLGMSNCADTTAIDSAGWEVGCDNSLTLTYTSDGSMEVFD